MASSHSFFFENTFIRYQEMGLIASAGYDKVKVFKKPKVKVIITGNERVEPTKEEILLAERILIEGKEK